MAKVRGIGGIFFKAEDAGKLRAWYQEHLGIEFDAEDGWSYLWREHKDPLYRNQAIQRGSGRHHAAA